MNTTLSVDEFDQKYIDRFWSNVEIIEDDTSCWEWKRSKYTDGYGRVWMGFDSSAHVVSYVITHGVLNAGMNVLHTCDNRACARPKHLYAGTDTDNMQDKSDRGRWKGMPAKLSFEKAREIETLKSKGLTQRRIAEIVGVSQPLVSDVLSGYRWVKPSV